MGFLDKIIKSSRLKSPWILHFDCGSCNGCDIEILAALMPRFDLERFGVQLKGTPRHADVMICTGSVTLQNRDRVLRVYEQVPDPKFVVAAGACATSRHRYIPSPTPPVARSRATSGR